MRHRPRPNPLPNWLHLADYILLALLAALPPARAEIVDRIIAIVGDRVITWSAVVMEANAEALESGGTPAPADPSPENIRALLPVIDRLADQSRLQQQLDKLPFAAVSEGDAQAEMTRLRARFPTEADFRAALARFRLKEAEVLERFERKHQLNAFIDSSLRQQVRVSDSEIEEYYFGPFTSAIRQQGGTPPPLSEVRDKMEEILLQARINGALEEWLEQLRQGSPLRMVALSSAEEAGNPGSPR